jgi:hypothetical protein
LTPRNDAGQNSGKENLEETATRRSEGLKKQKLVKEFHALHRLLNRSPSHINRITASNGSGTFVES